MKRESASGFDSMTYTVTRSERRKTSQITVYSSGAVEVRVPITKRDSEIEQMVLDKKEWILRKQAEFSERRKGKKAQAARTRDYLEERTWQIASKMDAKPSKIMIKSLRSRWGSCTKNGVINLNSAVLKMPPPVIDYVIVHELCHLKVRDHSPQFWELVRKHSPQYKKRIKWLESNAELVL